MPATYYVEVDGQVVGPLPRSEVERLLANGQITSTSKARPGYRREWSTVADALKRPTAGAVMPTIAPSQERKGVESPVQSHGRTSNTPTGGAERPPDQPREPAAAIEGTRSELAPPGMRPPSAVDGTSRPAPRASPPVPVSAMATMRPVRPRRNTTPLRRFFELPLRVHLAIAMMLGVSTVAVVISIARTVGPPNSDLPSAASPTSEAEPTRIRNSIGMTFVKLPAGRFAMGSARHHDNERPVHEVTIGRGIVIGIHEVTQREFEAVMGFNPSKHLGPNRPVDSVSWFQAAEFCVRLSDRPAERDVGRAYRLPTEAEWEYACRAGATTAWSFGSEDSDLAAYAWTNADPSGTSHEVGKKRPNAWGLFDMSGNVGEWVGDRYGTFPSFRLIDPAGPSVGELRVSKGGNFRLGSDSCRPAARGGVDPNAADDATGFRVVLTDGVPEHVRHGTEGEIQALIGVWQVRLRGGYSGRWTMLPDGSCRSTQGASTGTWRFEPDRVFIRWDNVDAWESFDRPIDASKRSSGDSWTGADGLTATKL